MAGELATLRAVTGPDFSIGAAVDARAAEALLAGFQAWYSVLSGILPELCVPILRAVQSGDSGRTRALNASLQPLWDAFTAHSSLRVAYGIAALLGHRQVVPPRPILPLDPMALRDSASLLVSLGIRL
jgi:4-hydroxy-tetrahydrodipicolinate synthase